MARRGLRRVEQRGGLDHYWALVDGYMATRDTDVTVRDVFGQSWAAFQAAFRTWLADEVDD